MRIDTFHNCQKRKRIGWGRLLLIFFIVFASCCPSFSQNSKKVKALKAQQTQLQKKIKKTQKDLDATKKNVQKGQTHIHFLGQQLDDRLKNIRNMEGELDSLDGKISARNKQIVALDGELNEKRAKYTRALRYSMSFKKIKNPLVFILSAKSITQMYRRARFAQEYATFQHNLGMEIVHKQGELQEAQNLLLAAKSRMAGIVREVMLQRRKLNDEQVQERKNVSGLKKKQKNLANEVAKQQKDLSDLNKKIDNLIAYEIEQARKRAEAAARKKAEEAAKKKAAEEAARRAAEEKRLAVANAKTSSAGSKSSSSGSKSTASGSKSTSSGSKSSTESSKTSSSTSSTSSTYQTTSSTSWLTPEEKQINGSFEQNRGRLPVPITGQYMIAGRFGTYNVSGLKNVVLDNKGTNYVGKPGARARCVFDGEVTAVFQFAGTKNVLVRHGSYISVYCNLSSVIVAKGQKIHTRDIIGTVANDGDGNCILHFQLRKETVKLNPEAWIGR